MTPISDTVELQHLSGQLKWALLPNHYGRPTVGIRVYLSSATVDQSEIARSSILAITTPAGARMAAIALALSAGFGDRLADPANPYAPEVPAPDRFTVRITKAGDAFVLDNDRPITFRMHPSEAVKIAEVLNQ